MTYLLDFKEQFAIAPLAIAAIAQGAYGLYRGLKADSALADLENRRQARFMDAAGPIQENRRISERIAQQGLTPQTRGLMQNQYASSRAGAYRAATDLSGGQMSNALSRLGAMNNINFALNLGAQNEAAQRQGQQMLMGVNQQLSGLQRADVSQDISDLQAQKKGYGLASQQGKMDVLGAIGGWAMGNLGKNVGLGLGAAGKTANAVTNAATGAAAGAAGLTGLAPEGTQLGEMSSMAPGYVPPTSPYNFGNTSLSPEAMSTLDNATQNAYRKPLTTTDVGQITAPANLADKITIPTVSRENRVAPGTVGPDSADVAKVTGEIDMSQFNQPEQVTTPVAPTQNYLGDLMGSEYTAKAGLGLPATELPANPYQNLAAPSNTVAQATDIAKVNPQEYQEPQEENYTSVFSVLENAGKTATPRGFMQPNQQQAQPMPSSTEDYRNMLMQESSMMGTPGYQFFGRSSSGQGPVQPSMFTPPQVNQQPSYLPFGQSMNMFGPQTPSFYNSFTPQGMTPYNTMGMDRFFAPSRNQGLMGQYQAVMTDQGIKYIPR